MQFVLESAQWHKRDGLLLPAAASSNTSATTTFLSDDDSVASTSSSATVSGELVCLADAVDAKDVLYYAVVGRC